MKSVERILLVWPEYEMSFWGLQHSLHRVDRKAFMAPLSLVTVAGMLPPERYELRHVDLNLELLDPEDVRWADLVMLSGWGPMWRSIFRVADVCSELGTPILMGGPLASEYHKLLRRIDHLFLGEAEGFDLEGLLHDIANARAPHLIQGPKQPDIATDPVMPRFDLLDLSQYWQATIQYARGCPFTCEFCDIIELYGRVPRTKSVDAVVRELERLYQLGFRGSINFVDDNFYGNRKNIRKLLPAVRDFQAGHGQPFQFYTQATVNLTNSPDILSLMRDAGFYSVFVGIETPNRESLAETKKVQNLKLDLIEAIDVLQSYELYVQSGFIMGFDSDPDDVSRSIIDYVTATNITVAMTGVLLSLPGTQLERRLVKAGRMLQTAGVDQFGLPNFVTRAHPSHLLREFRKVILGCFNEEALKERCSHQQRIFADAPARKADVALTELDLWVEHLRIYAQTVLRDLERLESSSKLRRYARAHKRYWSNQVSASPS